MHSTRHHTLETGKNRQTKSDPNWHLPPDKGQVCFWVGRLTRMMAQSKSEYQDPVEQNELVCIHVCIARSCVEKPVHPILPAVFQLSRQAFDDVSYDLVVSRLLSPRYCLGSTDHSESGWSLPFLDCVSGGFFATLCLFLNK